METVKYTLDAISLGTVIATLAGWLPPLAALLSIIWLSIQIWDRFNRKPE